MPDMVPADPAVEVDAPTTTPVARRWELWAAVVPGLLMALAMIWSSSWVFEGRRRFTLFDDAMISMDYARTLADTGELVWYPGAPRVEGITNPLWTLVMALLHEIGLDGSGASLAVMLLGLVCVVGSAVVGGSIAGRIVPDSRWSGPLATLLIGLCYPLIYWSVRGMEVGILALIGLGSVHAAIDARDAAAGGATARRPLAWLSVLLVLGAAVRIDFLVVAVVVLGWLALTAAPQRRVRVLLLPVVSLVAALVLMSLARWAYYGAVVPNTFTLKVTGAPLLDRLARGGISALKVVPVVALTIVAIGYAWRRVAPSARQALGLVAAVGAAAVLYSVYAGGDAWEYMPNRYVVPALLALAIAAPVAGALWVGDPARTVRPVVVALVVLSAVGLGFTRYAGELSLGTHFEPSTMLAAVLLVGAAAGVFVLMSRATGRTAAIAAAGAGLAVVLVVTSAVGAAQWLVGPLFHLPEDQAQTELGLVLDAATTDEASMATTYAGAPVYYSRMGEYFDILGKNDRVIAQQPPKRGFFPGHTKWDFERSVASTRPDVVATWGRYDARFIERVLIPDYTLHCLQTSTYRLRVWLRDGSTAITGDPRLVPCAGGDAEIFA